MRTIRGFRLEPASQCLPSTKGPDVYVAIVHVAGNGVDVQWPCAPGMATALTLKGADLIAEGFIQAVTDVRPDGSLVYPPLRDFAASA